MTDEALALLRTLVDGQREILDELRALRLRRRAPTPADLARHLRVVAVSSVVEGRVFSVRELLARAREATPEGEAMRAAIVGMLGELNAKRLGRLFWRIKGKDIGGLKVDRVGAGAYVLRVS